MREFTRFHRLAKVSAIDVGARVVHSRSSINTRGFCKANQSQLNFFASAYSLSLSLSLCIALLLVVLGFTVCQYMVIPYPLQLFGARLVVYQESYKCHYQCCLHLKCLVGFRIHFEQHFECL